jgi:hypothetical protein
MSVARAVVFSLALLSAFTDVTAAPRLWGIDQLAGARYGETLAQAHPDGFALGIFTQADLFGDALPVVDLVLQKRKVPLVRYNLRWSDSHTFTRSDFPLIVAEAKRFIPLVEKYPEVECDFSGATEHQLNAEDAQELARQVLAVIPARCRYVNNPWQGRGAFLAPSDRIINEVHGDEATKPSVGLRYNFSFDGSDALRSDVELLKTRFSDADVFFFWSPPNNGRRSTTDRTPRLKRSFWPTPQLLKDLAALAR